MQDRYDRVVLDMKTKYGLRINKWRSSTSGCAWEVYYKDGSVSRLIESPYPKGPMSAAIFLHEVGHHAIGLGTYKPRCLEEFKAWEWSLKTMHEYDLNVTPAVEKRFHDAIVYALAKALRRGLKRVPDELLPYLPKNVALIKPSTQIIGSTKKAATSAPRSQLVHNKKIKKRKKKWLWWLFPMN